MKDSEVYLRAAEIAHTLKACMCGALSDASYELSDDSGFGRRSHKLLHALFQPLSSEVEGGWLRAFWANHWSDDAEEVGQCRVLALLFMHQIALDEERKS